MQKGLPRKKHKEKCRDARSVRPFDQKADLKADPKADPKTDLKANFLIANAV